MTHGIVLNGKRYAASRYRNRSIRGGGASMVVFFEKTEKDPREAVKVVGQIEVQLAIHEIDQAVRHLIRSKAYGTREIILGDQKVPMTRYRGTVKGTGGETLTILLDNPQEEITVRGADNVQIAELEIEHQMEDPNDARHWKTVGFFD